MSVEENKEFNDEETLDKNEEQEINEENQDNHENLDDQELKPEEKLEQLQEENQTLKENKQALEEELADFKKKYQRLKADFVNYRKRSKREKDGLSLQAQIELLEEILPVVDNFERALLSTDEEGEFKQGIELIYKQLFNALKQKGLEKIECEGCSFDHKYHEAIMQVEDSDEESGTVVEELQTGYLYNGKVIRPAMVKVAQ